MDSAAKLANMEIEYVILVTDNIEQVPLSFTKNRYKYVVFPRCKQALKNPYHLLKASFYKDCDIVMNLAGGDGFTDIYGFGRVLAESYMTILGSMRKVNIVYSPQTIGPFSGMVTKRIADFTLRRTSKIFTRDSLSTKYCKDHNFSDKSFEVIDVAFALPYDESEVSVSKKLRIGINVSGLLYNGGYNNNNYFGLSFDYQNFIHQLIEAILQIDDYEVHLIPHVNAEYGTIEDDFAVCERLQKKYEKIIVCDKYISPIDIKSYISTMDFFTGARMHSTIAAFSSGVPVVPIAYSRKFNGLYGTLDYPFFIDAKSNLTCIEATQKIIKYIEERDILKAQITKSTSIFSSRLINYQEELKQIFLSYGA